MKAVLLSVNPALHIVDITHDVEPHNIRQGAYLLWASYKYFPADTIFVAIVDPGVGSARRILAVATKTYTFLGPDNGVLDFVLSDERSHTAVEISHQDAEKKSLFLPHVSSTFHGRDIFAPLAAHLSRGVKLTSVGKLVELGDLAPLFVNREAKGTKPSIVHIDRFGNIVTNIVGENPESLRDSISGVQVRRKRITRWIHSYGEAPAGTPCLIVGSSGLVEIVVNAGSAAELFHADLNMPIQILWK
jgi:S-adenosylmethionine hydrolase